MNERKVNDSRQFFKTELKQKLTYDCVTVKHLSN